MEKCVFCQIAQHQLKASIIYEDESLIAFHDIKPAAKVHVLIIPKKHLSSLNMVTEEDALLLGKMLILAKKLATDLKTADQGYKLVINTGRFAGQTINHLHLHLLGGEPLVSSKILEI